MLYSSISYVGFGSSDSIWTKIDRCPRYNVRIISYMEDHVSFCLKVLWKNDTLIAHRKTQTNIIVHPTP